MHSVASEAAHAERAPAHLDDAGRLSGTPLLLQGGQEALGEGTAVACPLLCQLYPGHVKHCRAALAQGHDEKRWPARAQRRALQVAPRCLLVSLGIRCMLLPSSSCRRSRHRCRCCRVPCCCCCCCRVPSRPCRWLSSLSFQHPCSSSRSRSRRRRRSARRRLWRAGGAGLGHPLGLPLLALAAATWLRRRALLLLRLQPRVCLQLRLCLCLWRRLLCLLCPWAQQCRERAMSFAVSMRLSGGGGARWRGRLEKHHAAAQRQHKVWASALTGRALSQHCAAGHPGLLWGEPHLSCSTSAASPS